MTLARAPSHRVPAIRTLWRASATVVLSLAAPPAAAQNQPWIEQLGTSAGDGAYGAAPDGSGGMYVAGDTIGSLGGPFAGAVDAWLGRYDSAGNQLWIRQFGTSGIEKFRAAAQDGSGGVYVSGHTDAGTTAGTSDVLLARYDSAGNQLWIRQFSTGYGGLALTAAPDGAGGVYVGGWSLEGNAIGEIDAWLARYDNAGSQLWIHQFGTSADEAAYAVTPDGSGGVYVGGETYGHLGGPLAGEKDAWLARYDNAGNQVWILQLGTSQKDVAYATAPDGAGGAYVSGYTEGILPGHNTSGSGDVWLARYDSAGNQSWIRQFGTIAGDVVQAAAMDGDGGVYLFGHTGGSLGGPNAGYQDPWLARYDGAGNQLWILQFGAPDYDFTAAAAPDGAGGVYLAGSTWSSLGGPNAGGLDAWLARHAGSCAGSTPYCTASTTSIPGCQAAIGAVGWPSLGNASGFTISSGSVPGGGNVGICFFGNSGAASHPFGTLGGQICVQPPVFRSAPALSGGNQGACNGAFAFTLQDLIDTSPIIVQGALIHAEIWARDPANPDGFLLSNGLELTVCP